MGRGTPCPMPPENRDAIRTALTCFWESGMRDRDVLAAAMQQLWPGCTANHVRGVIGGLQSKPCGEWHKRRSAHAAMLARK